MRIPEIFTRDEDAKNWNARRAEIIRLFEENVYGVTPQTLLDETQAIRIRHLEMVSGICQDTYMLRFRKGEQYCGMRFEVYYPKNADHPLPCAIMINPFQAATRMCSAAKRGRHGYFPYDIIVNAGYAAVQVCVDDVCFDDPQQFRYGILQLLPRTGDTGWGCFGRLGIGRPAAVVDFLCDTPQFDGKKNRGGRVLARGQSRPLVRRAGRANRRGDNPFVSGCTGAAMARGKQGERIKEMTSVFPHWTCERYASFAEREDELPVDQHMLLALCAPRPLYVSSASEDAWAHPQKEFEACVRAGEAYRALGAKGLSSEVFPEPNTPIVGGDIAYHVRKGEHGCTVYDWEKYITFMGRYFHDRTFCEKAPGETP